MPDPDLEVRKWPGHPDPYDKGGGSQKKFFSPSAPCILDSSHPLSHPFPVDYNYTCRRVKWNTGTMQLWHPFLNKQQQDHLSPRCAMGSNLLRPKGDWVQVLKPAPPPPPPATQLTLFLSYPPIPDILRTPLPTSARFCDTRISSFQVIAGSSSICF